MNPSDMHKPLRLDAFEKVSGNARYTNDLGFPHMLHAKILRSPHAHARIVRIDTARAEALPGVRCVVTGSDARRMPDPYYGVGIRDQPVLAIDKVRYVGDSVAAVAALDEDTAYRALALIDVEYDVLPPLATMDEALAEGAPLIFETCPAGDPFLVGDGARSVNEPAPNVLYEFGYERGDVEGCLTEADFVFTDSFHFSRICPYHLEPYSNIARVVGDKIELWSCNQDPFLLRIDLGRMFGVPVNQVRIHASYVGGGFGGKSYCKMEPLVVLLAKKSGAAVRMCLTMDEGLMTLTKHGGVLTLTTGVSKAGVLLARKSDIALNAGAYSDASIRTTIKAGYRIPGVYRWQAISTRARAIRTTTVPAGSFRGFGGTQASYASECQVDMIARRMGIDPLEFRLRNVLSPGELYAPGDSGMDADLALGLEHVAERVGYRTRTRTAGHGIGLSIGLKDGGGTGTQGAAVMKVTADGDSILHVATVEIGQGAMSALAQIAADVLGLPRHRVQVAPVDTHYTPLDTGTHVSFGTTMNGLAVHRAAQDVKDQILAVAAEMLACSCAELRIEDWHVVKGAERFPLRTLLRKRFGSYGAEFVGKGEKKVPFDADAPLRSKNPFWMPSWAGAEVSVDEATGRVRVLKLVVGADAGRAVDKTACRGQIEGAAMQAFSQAMFEELKFAGAEPVNALSLNYRVASSADLPDVFESIVEEHGLGPGVDGIKGIGESGMLAVASAIGNAIEDAIGVRVPRIPYTPERVLSAIDAHRLQLAARSRD